MENNACVYISTPESYSDVFDAFIKCLEKNWCDCKYPIIISTNHNKVLSSKYDVRKYDIKKDNWVNRTIECLSNVDYKYVILLMDDTIITKPVSSNDINIIIDEMEKYHLNYCKLTAPKKGKPYKESALLNMVKKNTPYARNIFLGIYNREYLLQELGDGTLSAWDIEKRWLDEAEKSNKSQYYEDVVLCNKKVIVAYNGVIAGKWMPSVKKKIQKLGINVESSRDSISFIKEKRMMLGSKLGMILSPKTRLILKNGLSKIGIKFASNK